MVEGAVVVRAACDVGTESVSVSASASMFAAAWSEATVDDLSMRAVVDGEKMAGAGSTDVTAALVLLVVEDAVVALETGGFGSGAGGMESGTEATAAVGEVGAATSVVSAVVFPALPCRQQTQRPLLLWLRLRFLFLRGRTLAPGLQLLIQKIFGRSFLTRPERTTRTLYSDLIETVLPPADLSSKEGVLDRMI